MKINHSFQINYLRKIVLHEMGEKSFLRENWKIGKNLDLLA